MRIEVSIRADLCCDSVYSYLKLRASQPVAWSALMQYDNVGRPAHQRIRHNGRTLLDKSYLWGDNLRLLQTLDTINRRSVRYDYDTFGSLSGAVYGDGSCQWRNPDAMGNVYDSPDRTDRSYGRGGQLREDRKWRYYYDSHGNLVLKTMRRSGPSLETGMRDEFLAWQSGDYAYTWQGNGMLRSVTRPDGKTVTFKYDALGRRIEKVFDGRVYRYLWDGDVILHEWDYAEADRPNTIVTETGEVTLDRPEPVENLITWVYDSDSYVPTAKIVGDRHYSIISDYIGRPVQAYDDNGNIIWQADYDIYGNLRNLHGSRQFIPFRQLGQYEDEETGLYYNRFRYYDPRIGNYISQDPIRLAGGNPTLYGYVEDCNKLVDILGFAPTKLADRLFLKEILGGNAKDGGVYMFRTIDVRDGVEKWYVGKANNLYRRLRSHLGSGKLDSAKLDTLNVIILPNGVEDDFFRAEAQTMDKFKEAGEDLANKIKSPGCKL